MKFNESPLQILLSGASTWHTFIAVYEGILHIRRDDCFAHNNISLRLALCTAAF